MDASQLSIHRSPSDPAGTGTAQSYDWRRIRDMVFGYRGTLVWANLIAIVAVLASVPVPLLMPLLVDEVLLGKPGVLVGAVSRVFPQGWHGPVLFISVILLVTVALRAASMVLNVWQTREFTRISKDVTYRMRRELLARLERVALSEYESLGGGAVASRLVTDLETIDQFVGATVSRFLVAVLTIVGTAVVLLVMHWKLALFILVMNPVVVYFTVALGKRVKELKRRENRAFELFQQALVETLDGIHEIRAANRDGFFFGRVRTLARELRDHGGAFAWKSDAAQRASFLVFLIGFEVFRAVSMLMVVFSGLTVGEMMAVFGYLWFMMTPVQEVLNIQYSFYGARAALERINTLLGLREEPRFPHRADPFSGRRTVGVDLEDIHFAYRDEPVLRGVTLHVAPGEKVALVGASGGGKSTLVQVILGLYLPQRGRVRFDGVPITEIGLDVVRSHVATVLQHPALFNDTVRANLTLGRDLPEGRLWHALEVAQLREVVEALPQGLETPVGRDGVRLSGGQRQRLAIARMVLSDPKVVILDEATSALDTETEARVHAALARELAGRTFIIVAHRLSAVRQADTVYVFEDGRIVESGAHEELIGANGLYAKLYGGQAGCGEAPALERAGEEG